MRADAESYRGIEYVRISTLPVDQKEKIKTTLATDKLIKILREGVLIEGCLQYHDYLTWFAEHHQAALITSLRTQPAAVAFNFSIK